MQAEVSLYVHSYDTDFMGIVNNLVYVRWFDDLRSAVFDQYYPLKKMVARQESPILAETHVRHLRPLTLDSSPIGRAWLSDAGRSRWRMEFEIRDGLDVCCLGWQKGCYYSLVSRKPVPFPNDFLDVCKRFLADGSAGIQNGAC